MNRFTVGKASQTQNPATRSEPQAEPGNENKPGKVARPPSPAAFDFDLGQ
jgi:hypothetical protein